MSSGLVCGFELDWFDNTSGILKKVYLQFFIEDNTIQLLTGERTLLSRIWYKDIELSDLFIGNTIQVFNKLMVVKAYANIATSRYMESRECHFILSCCPDEGHLLGKIFKTASKFKLNMGRVRTTSTAIVHNNININRGNMILEFVGINADKDGFVDDINKLGINIAQLSINDIVEVMASASPIKVPEECTLCLIKPNAIKSKNAGNILDVISENGFYIGGLLSTHLTMEMAEEFFDVYKTIYPSYVNMINHVTSCPVLAVMIVGDNYEVVERFRDLTGPLDPELAKVLKPKSLRALYGDDVAQNAIHCSDLPEDGDMESRFFFEILASL
jgi:nucleoside-diphosphate kinase